MNSRYDHARYEKKIYTLWEKSKAFQAPQTGRPYTILMPPPNANASLHAGHAMYTVDDVLVRYKRMQGFSALWIPGLDHAGFETQFVYEKELAKKGKSRMDFDRQTLYQDVFNFVKENSGLIYEQFKRLGFSADWQRSVFTLDENVVEQAYETFTKMEKEDLVYRSDYIVNYCTHCGTSLAELEVAHETRIEPLYYLQYGPFVLATVRPETKFADTAVAVNPKDKRYKQWVGKEIEVEGLLGKFKMKVIADTYVDPTFGTGVVKITPAHDPNDFEVWLRHKGEIPGPKQVIDFRGKLTALAGKYQGLKVKEARKIVAEDMAKKGLLKKVDEAYEHTVSVCYRCKHDLEPMLVPNWFIKVKELKSAVTKAVQKDSVTFYPARYKKHMLQWLEVMHDWPISRQIVWGIRIPVWYPVEENPGLEVTFIGKNGKKKFGKIGDYDFQEVEKGLQTVRAPATAQYVVSKEKPKDGREYLPETDTFDTWFSSGQWPMVTLKKNEFQGRFPTDVMGTLADILKFWVSRMILFSLYLKNEIPFKDVYLWSMVADAKGVKMSKSRGNVINPIELVEKYGADALRFSLLYGIPAGGKVILSDNKVRGMRNFANKLWNIARFVLADGSLKLPTSNVPHPDDRQIVKELEETTQKASYALNRYQLNEAAEILYDFVWHTLADVYIEKTKTRRADAQPVLVEVLISSLKLLHPFIPFVTEAVYQELRKAGLISKKEPMLLMLTSWPR